MRKKIFLNKIIDIKEIEETAIKDFLTIKYSDISDTEKFAKTINRRPKK